MEPEDKLIVKNQNIPDATFTANAPKEVKYHSLGQDMGILRKPVLITIILSLFNVYSENICVNNKGRSIHERSKNRRNWLSIFRR